MALLIYNGLTYRGAPYTVAGSIDDHARVLGRFQPGAERLERFVERLTSLMPPFRAFRPHLTNRVFSFLHASRACSTSHTRTASGGSRRRSGQSDQRSCIASNDSSGVSSVAVARDALAVSCRPAIICRSASGEPKKLERAFAVMPLRYHEAAPLRARVELSRGSCRTGLRHLIRAPGRSTPLTAARRGRAPGGRRAYGPSLCESGATFLRPYPLPLPSCSSSFPPYDSPSRVESGSRAA